MPKCRCGQAAALTSLTYRRDAGFSTSQHPSPDESTRLQEHYFELGTSSSRSVEVVALGMAAAAPGGEPSCSGSDVDAVIAKLLEVRGSRPGKQVNLTEVEIRNLCTQARDIFMSQPVLLELEAPIKICGARRHRRQHARRLARRRAARCLLLLLLSAAASLLPLQCLARSSAVLWPSRSGRAISAGALHLAAESCPPAARPVSRCNRPLS